MKAGELLLWAGAVGVGAIVLLTGDEGAARAKEPAEPTGSPPRPPEPPRHGAVETPGVVEVPAKERPAKTEGRSPADRDAGPDFPPVFMDDDVEAMARVVTSEVGRGPLAERVAIAWTARNRARLEGKSIATLVCNPCGKSSGSSRPFSSARRATPENRELAALVLAALSSEDPTRGATGCFEPSLQDRLHAAGRRGHRLDARGVRYCWLRKMDYYGSVGRWDLFGPKGGAGARPAPQAWRLEGFAVCCSRDKRAECAGQVGKVLARPEGEELTA